METTPDTAAFEPTRDDAPSAPPAAGATNKETRKKRVGLGTALAGGMTIAARILLIPSPEGASASMALQGITVDEAVVPGKTREPNRPQKPTRQPYVTVERPVRSRRDPANPDLILDPPDPNFVDRVSERSQASAKDVNSSSHRR